MKGITNIVYIGGSIAKFINDYQLKALTYFCIAPPQSSDGNVLELLVSKPKGLRVALHWALSQLGYVIREPRLILPVPLGL